MYFVNGSQKMNKYYTFRMPIQGECIVTVKANTKEEAILKLDQGNIEQHELLKWDEMHPYHQDDYYQLFEDEYEEDEIE